MGAKIRLEQSSVSGIVFENKRVIGQAGVTGTFAIDSTGVKFIDVTFPEAFTSAPLVLFAVTDPTATDVRFNTQVTAQRTATGVRLVVNVTTASATVGATAKFMWVAIGLEGV